MIAVLTAPDALVVAAVVTAVAGAGWWQSHSNAKQMKPNNGSTMRDAIDRNEVASTEVVAILRQDVIPRLDLGARIAADHANRLAVVEDRNAIVELANRVHAVEAQTVVTAAALAQTPPTSRRQPKRTP